MLKGLLASIMNCNIEPSLIKDVNIIVMDNDSDRSAEAITTEIKNLVSHFTISYFFYPRKGLAFIRNELIKIAFKTAADFIIFIDDDEFVTHDWLINLVKTAVINKADVVRGPVLVYFNERVSKYIKNWFKREQYPDNKRLFTLTTGNLLINRRSLEKYEVWFDARFNTSGSEDGYFGVQLFKRGAKLYWSANAIAYENIPKSRTSLKWLIRRIYRTSSTYSYMLRIEKEYLKLVKKALISIAYMISGLFALSMLLTRMKRKYWGVLKIAEGFGGIVGIMNITYKEYKKHTGY